MLKFQKKLARSFLVFAPRAALEIRVKNEVVHRTIWSDFQVVH